MPPVAPQPVQITCPACNTSFRTGIYTLIDVTEQPELKRALLAGQINVAVCPNCQSASMLAAPLIYHDAVKQLCLIYFPQELTNRPEEQEQFVGEATGFLMRSLPNDAPRSHLLAPRRFLTLPSMMDAILEADGISREMLEHQRAQIDLISELASALGEPSHFTKVAQERRAMMTPEFFATLAAFIEATPPDQQDTRTLLIQLHERLMELFGAELGAPDEAEIKEALERLADVADDELAMAVAELRGLIDYSFFQQWTAQIEAATAAGDSARAEALTARRTRIVEMVEELDREAQAMFEAGSQLLEEVLGTPDPLAALRERTEQVDEAFIMVLSANAAAAQRAENETMLALFNQLGEAAMTIIQDRMTPEERFINELLMADTPQDATRMLRTSVAKITPELIKRLNELADQEQQRANKPTAERLRQLARECGAMLF
ncbi:MAG: hypothetical protein EI684_07220 [Candidatus Viridilinea halotolerans]|uniref:CpXC domain-containing protein n=1 Tax=Candidatus Viridilinea halotolerans TaxID=2491704 RepID=A0A426U3L9_9CHLR|nr:MAG: hypothetical protein EI684_07220 [Candidatus Viridilinea halotolerans]